MGLPRLAVEFDDAAQLELEFDSNLKHGGTFVAGVEDLAADDACEIALVHPTDGSELVLPARVVWVGETDGRSGVGVALSSFDAELRERLGAFVAGSGEPVADAGDHDQPAAKGSPHERLRGLSLADALRVAREGEVTDRVVLERIYGKVVWEALLRNPRLTVPEVSRIARMGAIPLPLLEIIVGNASWLASPTVRRALLGNPRLAGDLMLKVLRATPRHELKLIPKQAVYSQTIKAAARKLLGT
jgi:Tfp pilus assembly protein PilZ